MKICSMHASTAVFGLALVLSACDSSERKEAMELHRVVTAYRSAAVSEKEQSADELERVGCKAPDVCQAREACLKSSRPTKKALLKRRELKEGLKDVDASAMAEDDPRRATLLAAADEAKALLEEGKQALEDCDNEMAVLKRRYELK